MAKAKVRKPVRRAARLRLVTGPDEHGSTYVYFNARNAKSERMLKHIGDVYFDYDSRGRLIGIELLEVPWVFPKE